MYVSCGLLDEYHPGKVATDLWAESNGRRHRGFQGTLGKLHRAFLAAPILIIFAILISGLYYFKMMEKTFADII
jgi:hypothetical protein